MTRRIAAIAALSLLLAVGDAQAQTLTSSDSRALFLRQVDRIVATAAADESTDAVTSLAEAFGAERPRGRLSLRREGDRYFAGLDGSGGRWFTLLGEAQGFLFRSVIAQSQSTPADVKDAVAATTQQGLPEVARAAAEKVADKRVMLTSGALSTITLQPRRLGGSGTPALAGPAGMRVDKVVRTGDSLTVTVALSPITAAGPAQLRVFAPGTGFVALDTIDAFVVAGANTMPEVTRRGGATPATAFAIEIGQPVDDALPLAGARNYYRLLVANGGRFTFATSGPSDTTITVQDEGGTVLGRDDDSGGWYNSRLSLTLGPGAYVIGVGHCCAGSGAYRLEVSP